MLVGKLCSQKARNVLKVMKKAGRTKGKLKIRDWGTEMMIFMFELLEDREWVMSNRPWLFDGFLFVVRSLLGSEQPS